MKAFCCKWGRSERNHAAPRTRLFHSRNEKLLQCLCVSFACCSPQSSLPSLPSPTSRVDLLLRVVNIFLTIVQGIVSSSLPPSGLSCFYFNLTLRPRFCVCRCLLQLPSLSYLMSVSLSLPVCSRYLFVCSLQVVSLLEGVLMAQAYECLTSFAVTLSVRNRSNRRCAIC